VRYHLTASRFYCWLFLFLISLAKSSTYGKLKLSALATLQLATIKRGVIIAPLLFTLPGGWVLLAKRLRVVSRSEVAESDKVKKP